MKKKRKTVPVKERKLGREKAWGLSYGGLIEIDPRLKCKKKLKIMVHEALHEADPKLTEREVVKMSNVMCDILWNYGYRKVEI